MKKVARTLPIYVVIVAVASNKMKKGALTGWQMGFKTGIARERQHDGIGRVGEHIIGGDLFASPIIPART